MPRDTKRIEKLMANARASRDLVREEIKSGASLQHIYDELGVHEQFFGSRLKELKEFNAKEAGKDKAAKEEQAKADRATKLAEAKVTLLAMPREELIKTAAGTKADITITPDTTIAQIVDAILLKAPENL